MKHLKAHSSYIKLLCSKTTSPKQRKAVLSTSSNDQMSIICEIFSNVLAGVLQLNKKDMTQLAQHAPIMRRLARRDIKPRHRHDLLVRYSQEVAEALTLVLKYLKL